MSRGRTKASIHAGGPEYSGGDGMQRVAGRRLGEALPLAVRRLRSNKWLLLRTQSWFMALGTIIVATRKIMT